MRLKKLTLTLVLASLGLTVSAQQTLRLSLGEAQQYAVEHNATMKNADLDVKKAELDRWKTLSSMLPSVKAGFDYQNMLGYEMHMGMGGQSISIPELSDESSFVISDILCGGMGVCIKVQNSATGESFALKGMLPEVLPDRTARQRFLKELDVWFTASSIDGVVEAICKQISGIVECEVIKVPNETKSNVMWS